MRVRMRAHRVSRAGDGPMGRRCRNLRSIIGLDRPRASNSGAHRISPHNEGAAQSHVQPHRQVFPCTNLSDRRTSVRGFRSSPSNLCGGLQDGLHDCYKIESCPPDFPQHSSISTTTSLKANHYLENQRCLLKLSRIDPHPSRYTTGEFIFSRSLRVLARSCSVMTQGYQLL
jgi:hypothetical protein